MSRLFINSVPKSGTYLLSEILKRAGLHQTYWHVAEEGYDDYNRLSFAEGRRTPEMGRTLQPIAQTLANVGDGAFAVGHLRCKPATIAALTPFQVVFLSRDLRECLVSFVRFMMATGRAAVRQRPWADEPTAQLRMLRYLEVDGLVMVDLFRTMQPWLGHPGVINLRFEDLASPGQAATWLPSLVERVGLDAPASPAELVSLSLSVDTLTKSSGRSTLEELWTPACEAWWAGVDGPALNRQFGYT